jgi:hypothetical protein
LRQLGRGYSGGSSRVVNCLCLWGG